MTRIIVAVVFFGVACWMYQQSDQINYGHRHKEVKEHKEVRPPPLPHPAQLV